MTTNAIEVRFADETPALERDGRRVRFVATVLDTPYEVFGASPFMETMARGVFDTTLARHKESIPLLVNHDKDTAGVGRSIDWVKDGNRLVAEYEFGSTPEARKVAQQAADGGFGGMSVSFIPRRSDWSSDRSSVVRREARLIEVSFATVPANADHQILELRSLVTVTDGPPPRVSTPELDAARRRLEEFRSRAVLL
jgi:HK97 family phage prohead protease